MKTWMFALGLLVATAAYATTPPPGTLYVALPTPCRVLDTRCTAPGCGTGGGPDSVYTLGSVPVQSGSTHSIRVQGVCGVPNGAQAVFINWSLINTVCIVHGVLLAWPAGGSQPSVSVINNGPENGINNDDFTHTNGSLETLAQIASPGTDLSFKWFTSPAFPGDQTDIFADIKGYFIRPTDDPNFVTDLFNDSNFTTNLLAWLKAHNSEFDDDSTCDGDGGDHASDGCGDSTHYRKKK